MKKLILVRHGNTFAAGDKVVWCGARTDLPLVESGEVQAHAVGMHLREQGMEVERWLCGPLKRTRRFVEILQEELGVDDQVVISETLKEIDYGAWEALSTEEIGALGGAAELAAWDKQAVWPRMPGWTPGAEEIQAAVDGFLEEVVRRDEEVVLACTSNGILRFFGMSGLVRGAPERLKVGTGRVCVLEFEGGWVVRAWDVEKIG